MAAGELIFSSGGDGAQVYLPDQQNSLPPLLQENEKIPIGFWLTSGWGYRPLNG